MGRLPKVFVLIGALTGLAGCAGAPVTSQLHATPPAGLSHKAELTDVPFFPQTAYHCGPAALATALNDTGTNTDPTALADEVYTPGREGTLQTEIVSGARRNGRITLPVKGMEDAFRNIDEGRPVLVLQNLGLEIAPTWHYAVLVGYDIPAEKVVLRSGTTRRQEMDMNTFEHTWARSSFWGLTFHRPEGPIPAETAMGDWLAAASGFERAGRRADAKAAYVAAAKHWPDSASPLVSLANVQIAENRLNNARLTLAKALRADPRDPVALNNMAHVLMKLGRLKEAERHALKAVDAGSYSEETARQTLAEIRAEIRNR